MTGSRDIVNKHCVGRVVQRPLRQMVQWHEKDFIPIFFLFFSISIHCIACRLVFAYQSPFTSKNSNGSQRNGNLTPTDGIFSPFRKHFFLPICYNRFRQKMIKEVEEKKICLREVFCTFIPQASIGYGHSYRIRILK